MNRRRFVAAIAAALAVPLESFAQQPAKIARIGFLIPAYASSYAGRVEALRANTRLPSTGAKEFAEAGGLIGYGVDFVGLFRRAAYFVDRILRGTKPSELPVEQATTFELVINRKAARALGVTIPQHLLLRADKAIE